MLNKRFHPANFAFTERCCEASFRIGEQTFALDALGTRDDIFHLSIRNTDIWRQHSHRPTLSMLKNASPELIGQHSIMTLGANGAITLTTQQGARILQSPPSRTFGVCGTAWLFCFSHTPQMRFYGMGQKSTPFEKSGRTHKFWNVDLLSDHGSRLVREKFVDPDYISVPYLIIKQQNDYLGILIDNPHCSIISTAEYPEDLSIHSAIPSSPLIYLGAEDGAPSLYLIYGPSLRELTRKLQNLVGTLPLPPLWALGYHQCRWGYRSLDDLRSLADHFQQHRIPVDGLWLDIDYMDGFRVFTFNKKHFPKPKENLQEIHERGLRVVPIIDPGVKKEPGYAVYESGLTADIYCKNPAHTEFIGWVWPGYTVFPDFSLIEARKWWAQQVADFAALGITAAWLDMNEPATGSIAYDDMLFTRGEDRHEAFHNQYGMLMAKATREGFALAGANERIFLLSRSGFTGSQQYAANWMGDNFSNYFHLAMSIPKSINLGLSGMPFNGPDVGGFGDDCTEQLLIDWIKAGFLFPFFRNHSCEGTRPQEPWAFTTKALEIAQTFIRLRYKLLPYLYNLFIDQALEGEPILRPLFYDFKDSPRQALEQIDDQFMIGPAIMQAPFVNEGTPHRTAVLPAHRWYRADTDTWIDGEIKMTLTKQEHTTPLFFRGGSIIPMQSGVRENNRNELNDIELLICLSPHSDATASYRYRYDDGISLDYQRGKRSEYLIRSSVAAGELTIQIDTLSANSGPVQFKPVTLRRFDRVALFSSAGKRSLVCNEQRSTHFGREITFYFWQ